MIAILYKTPPPHRTHHDPTFSLSPATLAFDLDLVKRQYRNRIAAHDKTAEKYIMGSGHWREREKLIVALAELDAIAGSANQHCPKTVAETFAFAMGDAVFDRFTVLHCEGCGSDYNSHNVAKTRWAVDNDDGGGSTGWRLLCPNRHVLYANIVSVVD